MILSASDMMMSVLWPHLSVETNFQGFLSLCRSRPLSEPTVHRASAKVTESGYCLARHGSEVPLNSLLATLTLLIAQRKGEEARDGVRPQGVKVKLHKICLHREPEALEEI